MEDEAVDPTQARGSTAIRHSPGHAAEGSPEMDAPNDDSGPENSTVAAEWMAVELPTVEENLALDEALLEEAHEGLTAVPVVRTWMAEAPVVVVGSSSRIADEVDEAACGDLGVRIVRRPSGGLTVLLGPGCLMWSVVVPHPSGSPPIEQIHASMLEPLRGQLNRAVADGGRSVERRGSSDLVLVAGPARKKCSGNALRVRRHAAALSRHAPRLFRHPPHLPRPPPSASRARLSGTKAARRVSRQPRSRAVKAGDARPRGLRRGLGPQPLPLRTRHPPGPRPLLRRSLDPAAVNVCRLARPGNVEKAVGA